MELYKALSLNEDLQGKLEMLAQRYIKANPDMKPEEAKKRVIQVNKVDPTGQRGIYTMWLVSQDIKGNYKAGEDDEKYLKVLNSFNLFKNLPQGHPKKPPINMDINSYKSYGDLAQAVEPYIKKKTKAKKQMAREEARAGEKTIYKDDTYEIIEVSTPEAATAMCKRLDQEEWCIKDPKWGRKYLNSGNLFFILKNGKKWILAHKDDIRDIYDRDLQRDQVMEVIPLLGKIKYEDKRDS